MLVVGLSGGPNFAYEHSIEIPFSTYHDAACVLIEDGKVVSAIEEERLNRIKHTNKFPSLALQTCLRNHGARIQDVDLIAYYSTKEDMERDARLHYLNDLEQPRLFDGVTFLQQKLHRLFNCEPDTSKFRFVHHHLAHAMSAFALSGFERGLVVSIDGGGDRLSGMIMTGEGTKLLPLVKFPLSKSLGFFYLHVIMHLGYRLFDEYKVMGLAPYGNPEKYRDLIRRLYTLHPNGGYTIHNEEITSLFNLQLPRRKWQPLTQIHKDLAASLQEALEEIVFHILRYYQQKTGEKNLCLSGGVAHNCTLNGKILSSGVFENVFVQPAAHDAGGALGAAFSAYYSARPSERKDSEMRQVYWGADIGPDRLILSQLAQWRSFIEFENENDVVEKTAELLSAGNVIGWAQGRSEFGPRSLGNRSIIADPRPAENKDRINQMVKKREGYRPFAPSVLEEDVGDYFEIPPNKKQLPFMVFVVKVREEKRKLLGAVTHVDGTARVQTVSRRTNERFWNLIHAFKERTGVPVLLNTSFNNNVEPIVDSVEDAIVCFLTTKLDYLVIGDYLIKKKDVHWSQYLLLRPSLPAHLSLHQVKALGPDSKAQTCFSIKNSYNSDFQYSLTPEIFRMLMSADGEKTLKNITGEGGQAEELVQEFLKLWTQRLILLRP